MLTTLRIQNLALVDHIEWSPGGGFVAITGETGAGKSVLLGALNLLLGERADRSMIRSGATTCTVEGVLAVGGLDGLDDWLAGHGLDACEGGDLILKRVIDASGANRQFVNGSPTTLAVLKRLGDRLVDLHGPHDHQSLFSAVSQMDALDAFAEAGGLADNYSHAWTALLRARAALEALSGDEAALEREADLLRHQVAEIEAAALEVGEEEEVEARYLQAKNAKRLVELAAQAAGILDGEEESVAARLSESQRLLAELERLDPSAAGFAARHESAVVELAQTASDLGRYAEQLDLDPAALAEAEERMNTLQTLKRKYGGSIEDVLAFGASARARLDALEGRGDKLARLEDEVRSAEAALLAAGEALSKARRSGTEPLAAEIRDRLARLGFARAGFEVVLTRLAEPGPHGFEAVEFQFAPNVGEPSRPLRAIASSGEISRVMLALKSAIAGRAGVPILVFDEIDANVGGEVAHTVGAMMADLARSRQILCITHLPQVAAAASSHFVVEKHVEDGRTVSSLRSVSKAAREQEIARMLGGGGEQALLHAREMLAAREATARLGRGPERGKAP